MARKLKIFPQPSSHLEQPFLWNSRIGFQPTVKVFGLPMCSQCQSPLKMHSVRKPHDPEQPMKVWSCEHAGCHMNQKIRLKPCCNCGTLDGRMLIDSRYNRALSNPKIWGPYIACRKCGAYGDPQGLEALVMEPDPLLIKVFGEH